MLTAFIYSSCCNYTAIWYHVNRIYIFQLLQLYCNLIYSSCYNYTAIWYIPAATIILQSDIFQLLQLYCNLIYSSCYNYTAIWYIPAATIILQSDIFQLLQLYCNLIYSSCCNYTAIWYHVNRISKDWENSMCTLIQINHQPDATVFQFIILTFIYSSKCFGRSPAHHQ